MGYDVHITRQINWFDGDDHCKISLDEWRKYILKDAEMRLENVAKATVSNQELSITREGLSIWTRYSKDGVKGSHAWFDYNDGNIVVKNPDKEIISKMQEVANSLDAKVQGDDGELYLSNTESDNSNDSLASDDINKNAQKPWWKFW